MFASHLPALPDVRETQAGAGLFPNAISKTPQLRFGLRAA
jgi:hypothetical protein